MSFRALAEALLRGDPYFGPAFAAQQGDLQRHRFFLPVIRSLTTQNQLVEPVRVLEIGSWAGASTVSWCDALKKCRLRGEVYCVDAWEPYFGDQEEHPTYRRMNEAARLGLIQLLFEHNIRAAGVADMVNVNRGRSQDVLPRLADQSFSVVYIDGSHSYESVLFDLAQAKRLVKAGGIICGDDLELQAGFLPDHELQAALQTGRDYVYSESAGRHFHPGVTAAIAQELGKVAVWNGFWAIQHSSNGWVLPNLDISQAEIPDHLRPWIQLPTLLKTCCGYNLVQAGDRYFAVAQSLGPVDLLQESLGDRELPPLLLLGNSLQELEARLPETSQLKSLEDSLISHLAATKAQVSALATQLQELEARLPETLQLKSLEDSLISDLAVTKAQVSALATQLQNWKDSSAEEIVQLTRQLKSLEDSLISDLAGTKAQVSALAAQLQNWKDSSSDELTGLRAQFEELYHQQWLSQHQLKVMRWGPGDPETPCAAGDYRGFSIFHFRGRLYALATPLHKDLDGIDAILSAVEGSTEQEHILAADTLDGIRTQIDLFLGLVQVRRDIQAIADQFKLQITSNIDADNQPQQAPFEAHNR
jgi:predicted O-methyltransferase YrrM/uncharacterized protein YjiS (DUF1127 family)